MNIPLGLLEGSMAAIPSKNDSFYCSKNSTAARKDIYAAQSYIKSKNTNSAVVSIYKFLQKVDDITINC